MDVRSHEGLLCARVEGRIPKVCLLCGATKDVVRRTQEYPVGANYGAGAGAGSGVAGALVAQSLRGLDRALAATIIVGLVVVGGLVVWVASRATQKVAVELPLCTTCDARWAEALSRRVWYLVAVGVFLALIVIGLALDAMILLGLALALLVGMLVIAKLTGQSERFVKVGFVRRDEIGLALAPEITAKIIERAERRATRDAAADAG